MPRPHRDGFIYADVKFRGKWDGIIVIDSEHQCIGVYVGRGIVQCPLPFTPGQIEQLRAASLWNRFLANLPSWFGPYDFAVFTICLVCPMFLMLGFIWSTWALLAVPLLTLTCASVMYQVSGFPLSRFLTSNFGLVQSVVAFVAGVLHALFP